MPKLCKFAEISLISLLTVVSMSCKKSEPAPPLTAAKKIVASAEGGAYKLELAPTDDLVWEVVEINDWLTPTISKTPTGAVLLTIFVAINETLETRTGEIVVTGSGETPDRQHITILQDAPTPQIITMSTTAHELTFDISAPIVRIDWGDDSTSLLTEGFNKECSHVYSDGLDVHTIKIEGIKLNMFIGDSIGLTSLDVSQCSKLIYLQCEMNALESIDLTKNVELKSLYFGKNRLTSIDLSNNPNLVHLDIRKNQITDLHVGANKNLNNIECSHNLLTSEALNRLFESLVPLNEEERVVMIKNNPGAEKCDQTIAQNKGWTVHLYYDDMPD